MDDGNGNFILGAVLGVIMACVILFLPPAFKQEDPWTCQKVDEYTVITPDQGRSIDYNDGKWFFDGFQVGTAESEDSRWVACSTKSVMGLVNFTYREK